MIKTVIIDKKEYIFVGTAHVSLASVKEVEETIASQHPDCVCVELDEQRFKNLTQERQWSQTDIIQVFRQRKVMLLLASLLLSSFQQRIGGKVTPGKDMQAAIEAARKLDITWELCDREITVTLRRAWRLSSFFDKWKMLATIIASIFSSDAINQEKITSLTEQNELDTMLHELSSYLPRIKAILIDERDQYIAQKLYNVSSQKVVAVLGAGHVEGVVKYIQSLHKKEATINLENLSYVPPRGMMGRVLGWAIPILVIALIASGFLNNEWEGVWGNVGKWVLINGTFSAIGALIAYAHPFTIISSFLSAPITSLNPTIGVGFVSGFVQLWIRPPRTRDFSNIKRDVKTIRGFFKNRATRTLLVFFFSSLGSAIGTFVALPLLFS